MSELLHVEELRYEPGGTRVLDVPALSVREGEVLAVIGPNGAGKSSLLQTLGLLQPARFGAYRWQGRAVNLSTDAPALRRQMAAVFQEALLLNESVADNVALGLRLRGMATPSVSAKVGAMLERLQIAHLAGRPARKLSGGEAQRVSLARALVLRPRLLFLDEPFASLDVLARSALLRDLRGLLRADGVTALFVTHDFTEIPPVADRVAVMMGGRIGQIDSPHEVFTRPASPEIRQLVQVAHDLMTAIRA